MWFKIIQSIGVGYMFYSILASFELTREYDKSIKNKYYHFGEWEYLLDLLFYFSLSLFCWPYILISKWKKRG